MEGDEAAAAEGVCVSFLLQLLEEESCFFRFVDEEDDSTCVLDELPITILAATVLVENRLSLSFDESSSCCIS